MIKEGENATLPANFVLRNVLLRDLNTRFSSGIGGIVVGEHLRESSYNRRIRLLPENAEDLIFLHDAWPKCKNML